MDGWIKLHRKIIEHWIWKDPEKLKWWLDMFSPILSAFNQMGGGIPINVTTTSNQAVGEEMLARAVAKGMMMAPAPVVSVEEYTSVANRVKYLEDLGNV